MEWGVQRNGKTSIESGRDGNENATKMGIHDGIIGRWDDLCTVIVEHNGIRTDERVDRPCCEGDGAAICGKHD